MARYEYTIYDEYTGECAIIRSNDPYLLKQKVTKKLEQWDKRAAREKERQDKDTALKQAEYNTKKALQEIEDFKNILSQTLSIDDRIDWDKLKDHSSFKIFQFKKEPLKEQFFIDVPKKSFWEFFLPFLKSKRLRALNKAEESYQNVLNDYNRELNEAKEKYELEKEEFERKQKEYNSSIDDLRSRFENSEPEAVEKYVEMVLEASAYPERLTLSSDVFYLSDKRTILIEMVLPNPEEFPKVIEYKYNASKRDFSIKEMKKADFKDFYEEVISQIAIRTIHEVFESVYNDSIDFVIFNGWVEGIDPRTGNNFKNCILSVQAEKVNFETLNLSKVTARECIKGLKGIVASDFINLAPIKPILHIDRTDKRIIETDEVIGNIDESSNLATMDWQLFESLVRDLFSKEFAGEGVEVKVTQASRDSGVDAIIFDPDPIKGGKFVIQAKRYNNVVGVSAVRDLYGTVLNEGAVKGILVATSNYGKDSIEFAKNKPLTLINGSELVYLFNKHGYKVNIQTRKK